MICKRCYSEIDDSCLYCPNCNAPTGDNPLNLYGSDHKPWHPMKWYKFLIYFALFAGAALNLLSAIWGLKGRYYAFTYEAYPALRTFEVIFSFALIALSALILFTRSRLARFRRNGPACLYATYATALVLQLANYIGAASIQHTSFFDLLDVNFFVTIITSTLLIALSRIYFKKRLSRFNR